MKFAIIQNFKVEEIIECEPEELQALARNAQAAIDISNMAPEPQIGWGFDGQSFQQLSPGYVPKRITKLAFRKRFLPPEMLAIYNFAELSNNTGRTFKSYLDDLQAATFIDLGRADTIASVNSLIGSVLTAQRASEILNNPIQEIERYKDGTGD